MIDLQTRLQAVLGQSYRVERELGGGGMSRVFLAEEVDLARKVVVKVLPPDMAAGLNADRFRREIQMAASLQHPHIVPLIASGRTEDLVWYTMPFIEGESLRAKLARERELPIPDAVRILRDVADALQYAHEHGVVHRDIKPDNVLITGRHAVVTDFGVAKAVSASTGESSLTSIGVALGTPAYMAPEQASADPHVDHRADIYSLGVMAYEMLSGSTPFTGAPQMVLAAHVTQAPEPVSQRRASIPPALATIIMRSLEKKAADRWQSAAELHQQFELMATPSGGAVPTSASLPAARPANTRPMWLVPGIAATVLIGALVTYVALKPGRGTDVVALDPRVVAVLPFRVAGADPSLHYLRQGMLDLLQAKLTGEGGPRAADARSVLAAFRDAGGTDDVDVPESGLTAIANKVGAARVVQGSVVGPPDHVVLSASLLEMPGARALAQATVEGPKDSLFTMVDRLTAQLLALGAGATDQQLSSLTTTSLDALRAYLDGVVAMRRGAFNLATSSLTRAVQLDSSFALAWSALVESHGWFAGQIPITRVTRAAWEHRDRLSAKDQVILTLRIGSRFPDPTPHTEQILDAERVTQQMPDNAEAWYKLGDMLFHYGPVSDALDAMPRAKRAFLRALQLDSSFGGPIAHLASVASVEGDTAGLRRWTDRMLVVDSATTYTVALLRWSYASQTGDATGIERGLAALATEPRMPQRLLLYFPFDTALVTHFVQVVQADMRAASSTALRMGAIQRRLGWELLLGRTDQVVKWADSLVAAGAPPSDKQIGLAWFGSLFGSGPPAEADIPTGEVDPVELFAGEIARLSRGNSSRVDRSVARLLELAPKAPREFADQPRRMAAVLAAWGAVQRGLPTAVTLLERADSAVRGWEDNSETNSVVLARLWEQMGRNDKAIVAIRRRHHPLGYPVVLGLADALRLEGRIAAKVGERDASIFAYERYLELRKNAEPSKVPQRDSVVAELAALKR